MADQCTATSKTTDNRCTRPAIPGGSVCRYHGGAAPQVKAAAAARLRAMVDPALGALEVRHEGQAPGPQGRSNGGKEVLDRAKPEGEGDGLEARSGLEKPNDNKAGFNSSPYQRPHSVQGL